MPNVILMNCRSDFNISRTSSPKLNGTALKSNVADLSRGARIVEDAAVATGKLLSWSCKILEAIMECHRDARLRNDAACWRSSCPIALIQFSTGTDECGPSTKSIISSWISGATVLKDVSSRPTRTSRIQVLIGHTQSLSMVSKKRSLRDAPFKIIETRHGTILSRSHTINCY